MGMRLRATSSAIGTGFMAASSHADCAPWHPGQAYRTSLALAERPGIREHYQRQGGHGRLPAPTLGCLDFVNHAEA
jgi:hypothetical protein